MAASAAIDEKRREINAEAGVTGPVQNALTVFHRAKVAFNGAGHATPGFVSPFLGTDGQVYVGGAAEPHKFEDGGSEVSVLGDTSLDPDPSTAIRELNRYVLLNKPVTGVTGVGDTMAWVYMTDDDTFTLTRTLTSQLVGAILLFRSAGNADVLMFGIDTLMALHASGAGTPELMFIGHFQWAAIADGDLRIGIIMERHLLIDSVYAMVDEPMVGSGGTILINLEIDGVNLTGGVVTVSTAAGGTRGTKLEGTAVTAANRVHRGDLIDVEGASAAGTRTSGTFDLFARVIPQAGI